MSDKNIDTNTGRRARAACLPCRSIKKKCNGERPCKYCKDNSICCEWGSRKKRGPQKGYVKAVEERLRQTERLLIQCLKSMNEDQLQSSVEADDTVITSLDLKTDDREEYWNIYNLKDTSSRHLWIEHVLRAADQVESNKNSQANIEHGSKLTQNLEDKGNLNLLMEATMCDTESFDVSDSNGSIGSPHELVSGIDKDENSVGLIHNNEQNLLPRRPQSQDNNVFMAINEDVEYSSADPNTMRYSSDVASVHTLLLLKL
ncbi:hypothetical protein V1511DRAFT_528387 [Dipodascopsis uninucleata]